MVCGPTKNSIWQCSGGSLTTSLRQTIRKKELTRGKSPKQKLPAGVVAKRAGAFERIAALGKPFEAMLSEPDAAYVAPWVIDQWRQQRMGLEGAGFTARDAERMSATRRSIVAAFKDAGVPMMAGSDTPHPFHVWGFGMIRDMEALGAAGLGPMGALRAATVVPRDYLRTLPNQGSALGWKADFGTVEAGARADLLLLDKDPSADLGALKSIRTVVAGGRVYDRAALDALLADARKAGTAQAPPSQAT